MPNTETFPHPLADQGIKPLRVNILAALVDLKTGDVFVGDLEPREGDKREYTASMVEGGVEKGQTLAEALRCEIEQETGLTNAVFLAAAAKPLVCHFEDWNAVPPPKYSGKIFFVAFYGIHDRDAINLDSGKDEEGRTFKLAHFKSLKDAETYLLENTTSDLRHTLAHETIAVIRPVTDALATARAQGAQEIDSRAIRNAMTEQQRALFLDHIPERLPAPDAASLAAPTSARRNPLRTDVVAETLVAK